MWKRGVQTGRLIEHGYVVSQQTNSSQTQHDKAPGDELLQEFQGNKILLVEGEPINLEIVKALFESVGLKVTSAVDGVAAVGRARAEHFDLILMDMNLPRLDGIEATYEIRQLPAYKTTPIIALTANVFSEDRERCIEAGMVDHLSKPVTPETLYSMVLRWLRHQ